MFLCLSTVRSVSLRATVRGVVHKLDFHDLATRKDFLDHRVGEIGVLFLHVLMDIQRNYFITTTCRIISTILVKTKAGFIGSTETNNTESMLVSALSCTFCHAFKIPQARESRIKDDAARQVRSVVTKPSALARRRWSLEDDNLATAFLQQTFELRPEFFPSLLDPFLRPDVFAIDKEGTVR